MSTPETCISCRKPKAQHLCGLCSEPVCRGCVLVLEEGSFAFLASVEDDLKHTYYCAPCHEEKITPALEAYQQTMEQAKGVFFFFDSRKHPVPLLKKSKELIEVPACPDRDETILRLGFMAASLGFNAVVDANVSAEKVRDHGYQKTRWRGRGWPALVDAERLERHLYD